MTANSASELLAKRAAEATAQARQTATAQNDDDLWVVGGKPDEKFTRARRYDPKLTIPADNAGSGSKSARGTTTTRRSSSSDSVLETFGKSIARELGRTGTQQIMRGVLGGLFRGR